MTTIIWLGKFIRPLYGGQVNFSLFKIFVLFKSVKTNVDPEGMYRQST